MAEQEQGADYYRHLIDEGVSERAIEQMIGEGWTVFAIYQAELEGGSIQPIDIPNTTPDAVNADKALAQEPSERELAIRARRFGSCSKCGGTNGHDYALGGVFCMNPLCGRATPAPDKALAVEQDDWPEQAIRIAEALEHEVMSERDGSLWCRLCSTDCGADGRAHDPSCVLHNPILEN